MFQTTDSQPDLRFDPATGLAPVIVQDAITGQVLMLGYCNQQAWWKTQKEGRVTFFSRSRNQLWTKGESSGNFLAVVSIHVDCDADTALIMAHPTGPTCHRGTVSCFEQESQLSAPIAPISFLAILDNLIQYRYKHPELFPKSYTVSLFDKGLAKIAQKVGEEAVETVIDAVAGHSETLPGEIADLIFHLLVLMTATGVAIEDVIRVLQMRHQTPSTRHLEE